MPQDAFTIKYLTAELKNLLVGGKISKITQPEKELLIFIIYTRSGSVKLEVCLSARGCRINIAENEKAAPQVAPGFCMLLRKHLQNAEICDIFQVDGERIVCLDFYCTSEFENVNMRLYIELMGKYSNAVLTSGGIILGALKSTAIGENTKRVLFSGAKYSLPEPQDKCDAENLNGLCEVFKRISGDSAKFISENVKGVSYATALDIVETFGENPTAFDVNRYICGGQCRPCVTYLNGEPNDFKVRSADKTKKNYESLLKAQTAYYGYICSKQNFNDKKRKLQGALLSSVKKLEKRLATINQKLLDCRDMESVKLKGELITANIYAVERGMDSFEAVNYYDENCAKIKIALDKTLSPADNAQKYYKRYAKLKRTLISVTEQKRETEDKLEYLNSINSHICAAEHLLDLEETEEELKSLGLIKDTQSGKKKTVKTSPFREFVFGGFKILAGRNNLQNDRLLKSVSQGDLWLHTQGYHSSHVVILCDGKEVPDGVLKAAAEICAYYSDGRSGNKIPVDYTRRKFVKKPPKTNAGFVIYSEFKTILVTPDGHAELSAE
ncbi:MAG: fibronectin/fibrinogen-binding protein [Clostridia bacterium]|nr:fibronectin/fibrinogen-binding protein [Clostridia bacterium]